MNTEDKNEIKQVMRETLADFWESVSPTIASKQDLDEMRAEVATKSDLAKISNKVDGLEHKVDDLDHKVDLLSRDVKEIRRRVIDLEVDTPTRSEFNKLKTKVTNLTN